MATTPGHTGGTDEPDAADLHVADPEVADPDVAPDVADPDVADPDVADPDVAGGPHPGGRLLAASWLATGAFTVAATAAVLEPDRLARWAAVFDCALFAVGVVAFLLAYARAVNRSRTEQVDILGVYFLGGGAAPVAVRRSMLASLAVQVLVAMVTASIRPYTSVAFGVLVPMLGLGLAGVWGSTWGSFPPRPPR